MHDPVPEIQINGVPIDMREGYLKWKRLGHCMISETKHRLARDERCPWVWHGGLTAPAFPAFWSSGAMLRKIEVTGAKWTGDKREVKVGERSVTENTIAGKTTVEKREKEKKKQKQSRHVWVWVWRFAMATPA